MSGSGSFADPFTLSSPSSLVASSLAPTSSNTLSGAASGVVSLDHPPNPPTHPTPPTYRRGSRHYNRVVSAAFVRPEDDLSSDAAAPVAAEDAEAAPAVDRESSSSAAFETPPPIFPNAARRRWELEELGLAAPPPRDGVTAGRSRGRSVRRPAVDMIEDVEPFPVGRGGRARAWGYALRETVSVWRAQPWVVRRCVCLVRIFFSFFKFASKMC